MAVTMETIGVVHTDADNVPRHWTVSDVKGALIIDKNIGKGLEISCPVNRSWLFFIFIKVPYLHPICWFKNRHTVMRNWEFSASVHPTDPIRWECRFWMFFKWRTTSFMYRGSI
jgi:hypothetical protein